MFTPQGLGLLAVAAMLVFYGLEERSPWFIIAFAGACAIGSVDGFLRGAWLLGVAESVWFILAVWRWWITQRKTRPPYRISPHHQRPKGALPHRPATAANLRQFQEPWESRSDCLS